MRTDRDFSPDPQDREPLAWNGVKLRINMAGHNDRTGHGLEARGFVQEERLRRGFCREGTDHDIVTLSVFRDGTPKETEE